MKNHPRSGVHSGGRGCGDPTCACATASRFLPLHLVPEVCTLATWPADVQRITAKLFALLGASRTWATLILMHVPADADTAIVGRVAVGDPVTVILPLAMDNLDEARAIARATAKALGAVATAFVIETSVAFSMPEMIRAAGITADDVRRVCGELGLDPGVANDLVDPVNSGDTVLLVGIERAGENATACFSKITGGALDPLDRLLADFGVPVPGGARTLAEPWIELPEIPDVVTGYLPAVTSAATTVTAASPAVTPAVTPPSITPTGAFAWVSRNNGGASA